MWLGFGVGEWGGPVVCSKLANCDTSPCQLSVVLDLPWLFAPSTVLILNLNGPKCMKGSFDMQTLLLRHEIMANSKDRQAIPSRAKSPGGMV